MGKRPLEIRREAPAEHVNPPKAAENISAPKAAENISAPQAADYRKATVAVLIATVIVRLGIASFAPLFPDETYYWEWSRRLATGYFDHPPLVAWLIRAGTTIFGDTAFGIRFFPIVAGVIGTLFVAATARRMAGDRAAFVAIIAFAIMPISAAGLVLATSDPGMVICVAAVLYCVLRAIEQPLGSRASFAWWCFAGVAQGFSFWGKYTAVLVPVGLGIAMLSRARWRPRFREAGPYAAISIASIVFLPALVWNARQGWPSFMFQLQHGLTGNGGSITLRELELAGGQLGLVSPILLVMMILALGFAVAAKPATPAPSLLAPIALFVFTFFALSATKRRPEANWPAIAYLPATLVLVAHVRSPRWDRWLKAGLAIAGTVTLVMYVNTFVPIVPVAARRDPTARAAGWEGLARTVSETSRSPAPNQSRFFAGNRYQEASQLAYHLPGHPETFSLNLGSRPNQYDLWPSFAERAKRGDMLVLVADDLGGGTDPLISTLAPHFDDVDNGQPVTLARGSDVVKYLRIWTLNGWRGTWPTPPLRSQP